MPYIPPEDRLAEGPPNTPGELNYELTKVVNAWLVEHGTNYKNLNTVIGVFECAKLELYRRIVTPYEDAKMYENGDVYTCQR